MSDVELSPPRARAKGYENHPGRAGWYNQDFDQRGKELALLGCSIGEMAQAFGVSEKTIDRWLATKPSFRKAVQEGQLFADGQVAGALHKRATGYSHDAVKIFFPAGATEPVYAPYTEHYPPDTAAASLWLRNRQKGKWVDRTESKVAVQVEALILGCFAADVEAEARKLIEARDASAPALTRGMDEPDGQA